MTRGTALVLAGAGLLTLAAGVVVYVGQPAARPWLLAAGPVGAGFGWLAYRLRLLDASGAVAGGVLGAAVVGLGGWAWMVPSFAFFLPSSLLSKAGARRKAGAQARLHAKGSVRDAAQVGANGAVGWVMLMGWAVGGSEVWYWGFVGAFAAAAADTWATEIGMTAHGRPRHVLTGKRVPPGTSGGVSLPGTLGACAGAAVVWLSAWPVAGAFPRIATPAAALVAMGGVLASFVDSLAGAAVQARYLDPVTGEETERTATDGRPHVLVHGYRRIDNDAVNLLATLVGALFAMACFRGLVFGS